MKDQSTAAVFNCTIQVWRKCIIDFRRVVALDLVLALQPVELPEVFPGPAHTAAGVFSVYEEME